MSRLTPSTIWHSQMTKQRHPSLLRAACVALSLATLREIFVSQYVVFEAGIRDLLQPCLCQKQPFTKTAVLYLGRTRSGLPGRTLECKRKRKPAAWRPRRTNNSGEVPLDRTSAIIRLRVCGSTVSVMHRTRPGLEVFRNLDQ